MVPRICCFLVMLLSTLSLMILEVSSRHFGAPNGAQISNIPSSNEGFVGFLQKRDREYKEVEKIGSKPPKCEDKCYGCKPCEAIQVPTTNSHVGVQYTNYEPEGWKCKCGHSFFSP